MAIGDSLEKIIAARRNARADSAATSWLSRREELFAPIGRRLRVLIRGVDARFIKSRITRERAVIRIGNGEIDAGWDILPNAARSVDPDAPLLKVIETRDYMSEHSTSETVYFDEEDRLIDYLQRRIMERTTTYLKTA